ncbi:glutamate 5-kinase [Sulfoacidibacillus thermotolerans]|uniref:Glutamate 5-kinase n=1 Tax=Sulfoacidibacillus thermotolerans TaxID=1765684 RepID=A0A2U3D8J1_SULT2|nr:glutamate 5-kinase [Sulfoacidibacillus thermotolerans]PWI57597.1 glutamate 5-kinase [Sulfoacidibacillus thermotolerans]
MQRLRIVVKVGSSSLTDPTTGLLSSQKVHGIVERLAPVLKDPAYEVILVSSGAIAAGRGRLGWRSARTVPEKQAASAVGQSLLIDLYQREFMSLNRVVAQILLTRSDMENRRRFVNIRNTLETLLEAGVLPIVNENDTVAVNEIRFGDNDSLAALVAILICAQHLILLTDIDGLYTEDPRVVPDAKRIEEVEKIDSSIRELAGGVGSSVGTGGMHTKIRAAEMAIHSGIEVVIAAASEPNVLMRLLRGERLGTRFLPEKSHWNARKSWLVHGSRSVGRLYIDAGAARAVRTTGGSLLLPGIERVEGRFDEGAIVELIDPEGRAIAKGIVSFSARDLEYFIKNKSLKGQLHGLPEVVHRNDLALLL